MEPDEQHRHETCDTCKGAASHHFDHYATGRLRLRMATDLGLTREASQGIPIGAFLRRWHGRFDQ